VEIDPRRATGRARPSAAHPQRAKSQKISAGFRRRAFLGLTLIGLFESTFKTSYRNEPTAKAMSTATLQSPLFERIHSALTSSPFVPSNEVRVEAADGRVVLKGSVRSFFQKQMAQEAIRRVDGVETIDNLLEVNWA
jgi:hypothetical protein